MNQSQELQSLQTLPLMQGMPDAARARLAQLMLDIGEIQVLSKGDTLFHQGGLGGDTGFVILTGAVQVERDGESTVTLPAPALLGEMHQLNPKAQRTATVQAQGPGTALKFSWREFYLHAKGVLAPPEQAQCMKNLERLVLERFHQEALMDLPLLRGLSDHLRLRVSLAIQWMGHQVLLADGVVLFKAGDMCGDTGYLLAHGDLDLSGPNQAPQRLAAPDVVGVFPDFDPDLRWTVTAVAHGPVEIQRFAWLPLMRLLEQRLPPEAAQQFFQQVREYAKTHFAH